MTATIILAVVIYSLVALVVVLDDRMAQKYLKK